MARVCVLLAPGFEEIEAVCIIDVLRRAEVDTTIVGVEAKDVRGAHGIRVEADALLSDAAADRWDMIVLPGGLPGSTHLRDSEPVQALLRKQQRSAGHLAAICAAPIALSAAGVLAGKKATSYPGFAEQLDCGDYVDEDVVVDGKVITSRGPGTALHFALRLVAELGDSDKATQLAAGMLVADP